MADDRILNVAADITELVHRHGFRELRDFSELFEAFEIATSRVFGQSVRSLNRHEELRMIREIYRNVAANKPDQRCAELERRAMAVVSSRGKWNIGAAVDSLAEFLLGANPTTDPEVEDV